MTASQQGELSYHLTTTKTPQGETSYARIKFPYNVHHYVLQHRGSCEWLMNVWVFDLEGNYLRAGDELHIEGCKSDAIGVCRGMVEEHLNDEYPLN